VESKKPESAACEEYERTAHTPLDHRGTSGCPFLGATGGRAVYRPADSVTAQNVLFQTAILFACAAFLLFIIRRKERLGWDSVGLQRPPLGNTAIWVVVTFVAVLVALAMAFALIKLFHLPVGSMDSQALAALPKWVLLVAIIRAGFIEELFCRGYAIERLQSLTGSLIPAAGIPLFIFAVLHYRQGWASIIVALLTGAVLTAVYIYKRNLWVTITVHFVVDFILLLPLLAAKH
jgi:membrane protease YdiL (CAAX protease family)